MPPRPPDYLAVIASPCFSCGVTLVIDMLLLLGVRVDFINHSTRAPHPYWRQRADGRWELSAAGKGHFGFHSKLASKQESFDFPEGRAVLIGHNPAMVRYLAPSTRAVMVVRDPVDAIYSWQRRQNVAASGITFEEYLQQVLYFNVHKPYGIFQSTPLELYALFCAFWLSAAGECHVMGYEDFKAGPEPFVDLMAYLGVPVAAAEVHAAFARVESGSEAPARIEQYQLCNLKGQPREWTQRMAASEHAALLAGPLKQAVYGLLGYSSHATDWAAATQAPGQSYGLISGLMDALGQQLSDERDPVPVHTAMELTLQTFKDEFQRHVPSRTAELYTLPAIEHDCTQAFRAVTRFVREVYTAQDQIPFWRLRNLTLQLTGLIANSAGNPNVRHMVAERLI
ncbi:hypothetical protein [Ideonella sp.]|jgi:hypothetical protein|uniref:hypothetical protein n=1 Tax=Ideonella sp. TaxID=1929293 RepID=UPI0037BF627A